MKIKCYSLLTLDRQAIKNILPGAEVADPIARHDLQKDVDRGYNAVLIIDGKFHQSLAVSPAEIMDAIRTGVRVYGSSSMGALRAVEMKPYGMIGHGEIYEMIQNEEFFRDDFLGQVFDGGVVEDGPAQASTSYAFIDFYFNLRRLVREKRISAAEQKRILSEYSNIHFAERSPFALIEASEDFLGKNPKLKKLVVAAATTMGSQKKVDAVSLLKLVRRDFQQIAKCNEALRRLQQVKPRISF